MSREEIEKRDDDIVNNKAQYCSVVRTGIGNSRIVIGGEVDAVWDCKPDKKEDPINWVELKTTAEICSDRDLVRYERKLLKFWAQSFLLGVPKIVVGFRDPNGILRRLEEMATAEIPILVKRRGKNMWDGNICINFTAAFLSWLRETITTDGVWRIRRREKSSVIEVYKLEEPGHGDILSDAFVAWRSQFE
ncbi:decapping endonuclease targeting mRNA [Ascosphaera atra]|nr:decapping endonuclease targeting mRNA [Ascosphaera atra]